LATFVVRTARRLFDGFVYAPIAGPRDKWNARPAPL